MAWEPGPIGRHCSAWQTATGKDTPNSISGNPQFVSASNLHLNSQASPVADAGTPIGSILNDFDGDPRSAVKPEMGADEIASNSLSNLTLSAGTLAPAFDPSVLSYTASVSNSTSSITVTPTVADINATIEVRVNGGGYSTVASGSPSGALALNVGANTVDVRVTPEAGPFGPAQVTAGTPKIYTVTVTRAGVGYL